MTTYAQELTTTCLCGRTIAVLRRHPERDLVLSRHLWPTGSHPGGFCTASLAPHAVVPQ